MHRYMHRYMYMYMYMYVWCPVGIEVEIYVVTTCTYVVHVVLRKAAGNTLNGLDYTISNYQGNAEWCTV